ncbi:MAG: Hpt domain-containing protein [Methylococcaceae bacterium]|nr:Hpt domain-containing protein [Methylococcaceae bacterium]
MNSASPTAGSGSAALLDEHTLQKLAVEIDEEARQQILRVFFTETAKRMARIAQALSENTPDVLGHEAHSLKSSAQLMGAKRLAEKSIAVDEACRQGNIGQASVLAQELITVFEATRKAYIDHGFAL